MIPKQIQHGGTKDEAAHMNVRKVQKHDEPDEEENRNLKRSDAL